MMFMLEMSTIEEKHMTALAGMKIVSKGMCTITCKVVIIIHSFFIETPRNTERNKFVEIAPEIAVEADVAIDVKAFVAAKVS